MTVGPPCQPWTIYLRSSFTWETNMFMLLFFRSLLFTGKPKYNWHKRLWKYSKRKVKGCKRYFGGKRVKIQWMTQLKKRNLSVVCHTKDFFNIFPMFALESYSHFWSLHFLIEIRLTCTNILLMVSGVQHNDSLYADIVKWSPVSLVNIHHHTGTFFSCDGKF